MKNILFLFLLFSTYLGTAQVSVPKDSLGSPTKSNGNYSKVIGWKDGETPVAPLGFTVTKYADGFQNPRWLYVTPNGDILVAQSNSNYSFLKQIGATLKGVWRSNNLKHSANIITLLRDSNKDGILDLRETFLSEGLNQPFGMLVIGDWFYVANTNAILRYPYKAGQTKITGKGEKIVDLPAGKHNRHWSRNIIANSDNSKIYVAVGSGSNIAENGIANELLRANILEINPDGSDLKVFAAGLRNPVGMDWAPETKTLWTVVNERDGLGDDLVPDYLTSVKENAFYGWPYAYFGQHEDVRVTEMKPELVKKTIVPDFPLGAHTASLGLAFYTGTSFPEKYKNGAFIAQHGSWNRKKISGYRVIFVPFKDGKPSGKSEEFLTGFIVDPEKDIVHGRPVCVIVTPEGDLLITDDKSNTIWRVTYTK
ncbi:PQQ-dependent sugar dehydrogenase [Flavobacterium sp. N3904]|uniref:PQQ-dependent sugar dehydrogenase n=1 Tax=Flavobacterium sp. N3904 TaxID=2986835 RepID=UPI002224C131|nr:sorbosone dehydrogenase family protein [Flavobacterium sp. N3904]